MSEQSSRDSALPPSPDPGTAAAAAREQKRSSLRDQLHGIVDQVHSFIDNVIDYMDPLPPQPSVAAAEAEVASPRKPKSAPTSSVSSPESIGAGPTVAQLAPDCRPGGGQSVNQPVGADQLCSDCRSSGPIDHQPPPAESGRQQNPQVTTNFPNATIYNPQSSVVSAPPTNVNQLFVTQFQEFNQQQPPLLISTNLINELSMIPSGRQTVQLFFQPQQSSSSSSSSSVEHQSLIVSQCGSNSDGSGLNVLGPQQQQRIQPSQIVPQYSTGSGLNLPGPSSFPNLCAPSTSNEQQSSSELPDLPDLTGLHETGPEKEMIDKVLQQLSQEDEFDPVLLAFPFTNDSSLEQLRPPSSTKSEDLDENGGGGVIPTAGKKDIAEHLEVQLRLACHVAPCVQEFEHQSELDEHLLRVHQRLPDRVDIPARTEAPRFACSYCPKQYRSRETLYHHNYVYHDRSEFPCPEDGCCFVARYRSELNHHQYHQHGGGSRFGQTVVCGIDGCRRRFARPSTLNRHQVERHRGRTSAENSNNHQNLMESKKRITYRCRACGFVMKQKKRVAEHIQDMHGQAVVEANLEERLVADQ